MLKNVRWDIYLQPIIKLAFPKKLCFLLISFIQYSQQMPHNFCV